MAECANTCVLGCGPLERCMCDSDLMLRRHMHRPVSWSLNARVSCTGTSCETHNGRHLGAQLGDAVISSPCTGPARKLQQAAQVAPGAALE